MFFNFYFYITHVCVCVCVHTLVSMLATLLSVNTHAKGTFPGVQQEMSEDHSTPKKEKQERLSKHKENMQHSQAEEEAQLLAQQRVFYDRNCRAFKRKVIIKRHDLEQEQMREVHTTQLAVWFRERFFLLSLYIRIHPVMVNQSLCL